MNTNTSIITKGKIVNNSPHYYTIYDNTSQQKMTVPIQKYPIQDVGRNGYCIEELMLIIIDQLEHYQNSDFATIENGMTLHHMYNALHSTRARQYERHLRGVQDTLSK